MVRQLDEDVKARLQRRARRHARSTEDNVKPLGSRLAALFAGIGLKEEIPELRGQSVRPVEFKK